MWKNKSNDFDGFNNEKGAHSERLIDSFWRSVKVTANAVIF